MGYKTDFLFLLGSCMLTSACQSASREVSISGRVDSLTGIVRLLSDDQEPIDSVNVENNKFNFSPNVPNDGFYTLNFKGTIINTTSDQPRNYSYTSLVYLEKNHQYEYQAEGPYNIGRGRYNVVSDSQTMQELNKYNETLSKVYTSLRAREQELLAEADRLLEARKHDQYVIVIDSLNEHVDSRGDALAVNEYLAVAKPSALVPYLISTRDDHFQSYTLYKKAMESLDSDHRSGKYSEKAFALLKSKEHLHAGAELPEIHGSDVNGKRFNYDFSKNQYTLVNVWAAWSPASRHDMVDLKQLHSKYKEKGFDIVGVSVDSDLDGWKRISKHDAIPWYHVSEGLPTKDSKNVKTFMAKHLPLNFLVDGNKRVITRNIEADKLDKLLMQSLK